MNKNNTKQFLNPRETEVISRLSYEKLSVITRDQFDRLFKFTPAARDKTITRLTKKGILKIIRKRVYFYSPLESGPAGSNINEYIVPPLLFPRGDYYAGYSTMYNYYGFLDQISQTMYILNTAVQKQKYIGNMLFKMIRVSPKRMYGLEKIRIRNSEVAVSDKERTLVDLIYFPGPVGSLKKAMDILKAQVTAGKVDIKKLIKYAVRFPSISTRKRIGFVIEQCKASDAALKPLLKSIRRTSLSTIYGSKSRKGAINNKWKVIIDDPQQ
jgi:predicted transcriptional regulator of viral defense system